jgi:hypothetical protein
MTRTWGWNDVQFHPFPICLIQHYTYMPKNRILLEAQNSILSITVGVIFLLDFMFDGNLYTRFPDTYRFMKFLPSFAWGVIYAGAGFIHLYSLIWPRLWLRKNILLVKTGLWTFLGFCVVYADVYAASGWFYFIFAGFAVGMFFKNKPETPSCYDVHTSLTN